MKLSRDWKYVTTRAWSMRWLLATAILGAVAATLPLFSSVLSPAVFAGLSMLTAMIAAISNVLDQPGMDRRKEDVPVAEDRRK